MNDNYIPTLKHPGSAISQDILLTNRNIPRFLLLLENTLQDLAIELSLFDKSQSDNRIFWSSGNRFSKPQVIPNYFIRLTTIHARSFIYSLERIEKLISTLKDEDGVSENITHIHIKFTNIFPDLVDVRHSSAHSEDRIRRLKGIGKNKKNIPFGNTLFLETIQGNSFTSLMANGNIGKVEINLDSLLSTRDCIHEVIDSFQWQGFPRNSP